MTTRYRVRESAPDSVRSALSVHSALLQDLFHARNILDQDTAAKFLQPEYERDSHDPHLLPDMGKAVERILFARERGEQIAVWSDYDCDGIPGGVLLTEFLRSIGLSVRHYIPHRHKEGFGLNKTGLEELAAQGITLAITVDLGTSDVEPVAFANTKGIDIIVTDHHLPPPDGVLPPALAIVNPKMPGSLYPFDGLCGAGMAWKLVQGILQTARASSQPFDYAQGKEKWLLDLAAMGTLSDMVPLVGENRMIARYGLVVMRKNRRPGLASLLSLLRIRPHTLTEDDIGFMVAPRINAASRMDSPDIAARLLATKDTTEGNELARALNGINDERKVAVALIVKEVNKRLLLQDLSESPVIVMGNPNWRPGVLGLVANSLMQAHGKTVFLWGREGGDTVRGSCRSAGVVSVVELMGQASDMFDHFGGHFASGGFALPQSKVHELAPRLMAAAKKLTEQSATEKEVVIDRMLDLAEVPQAHRELSWLAPFGVDNQKPLFLLPNISISKIRSFGKAGDHLETTLSRDGTEVAGISFFSTPESFQKPLTLGMSADIVGHVETDWRGKPRLRVVDVL